MTTSRRNPSRRARGLRSDYAEVENGWIREYTAGARRFLKRQLVRLNRRVFRDSTEFFEVEREMCRRRLGPPRVERHAGNFGRPTVHGIPTYVLAGPVEAGDSVAQIAAWFDVSEDAVRLAIEYERKESTK